MILVEDMKTEGRAQAPLAPPRPSPVPRPAPRAARLPVEMLVLVLLAAVVLLLSFAPLLRLGWTAIAPGGVPDLSRLAEMLTRPRVLTAAGNTLFVALGATALALVLGVVAAILVSFTDLRAKSVWVFGFVLPLMIPPQVMALAWVQAFSPNSAILGGLGLAPAPGMRHPLYSAGGIILLLGIYNAPLVFLSVRAALRRVPADLIEAARAAGARAPMLLRTVVLPLAAPGIWASAALAFVSAIGNFGIQAMLGIPARYPTLITLIYQQLNNFGPSALSDLALLSLLLAALTVAGIAFAGWMGRRGDVRTSGLGRRVSYRLGRARLLVELAAWGFLIATMALPLSSLFLTSLVRGYGQPLTAETLTFANYANALLHHAAIRGAFFTSLWLTALAVVVLTAMAVTLGWFITWRRGPLARLIQGSADLAYALPGVVIGIAMILFFLRPLPGLGFSIYGTVWIILAAYLANFLALALRPVLGGFAQIERAMDEAARIDGAGFLRRLWDISWPMVAPAAAAGAIIVFLTALNEIQVSILLVSSSARTIGPMIIFLEEAGSSTLAAATGCLMVVLVLALMLGVSAFARRLPEGVLPWRD